MQIAGVTDRGTHWRNRVLRLGARILCMATVRRHTVDGRALLPLIVRSLAFIECINKPAGTGFHTNPIDCPSCFAIDPS